MINMLRKKYITYDKGVFCIQTADTGYLLRITESGHPEHIHYGARVSPADAAALALKTTAQYGSSVMYSDKSDSGCLDVTPLEWSGTGRGDYRRPPLEVRMPGGSFTTDFRYASHTITEGVIPMTGGLPQATGGAQSLSLLLRDETAGAELTLIYTVFPQENVLTRRTVLKNVGAGEMELRKLMSLSMDLEERGLVFMTFDGGWIREAHRGDKPLHEGTYVNESRTGSSSNRSNPGFILRRGDTGERHGKAWGFNLVYSGNHHSSVSVDEHGCCRVMSGINPDRFSWTLSPGESFETPEAVLSFSDAGLNGLSHNMHAFVNAHIVRGSWAGRERPVLINVWEAFMFDFTRDKLLGVARKAKALGMELFVLDDGWFGDRNGDSAGLGDYRVNEKKLPGGLSALAKRINAMGMDFGLWFEPEAVNPDSDLYRAHPDWAIGEAGRAPVYGRNELLLDLTKSEVRDYIVDSVSAVLDSANISYVKWDMNRHMTWPDGAFSHRYTLGLYEVLGRIFGPRPDVLLESCSSGGNRFDLGMLCYSPQIWTSDNTDPIERLDIQKGLSYLYPLSTMGAHVSESPHSMTLRHTPLSTRFNAACFGCLGYELDLRHLPPVEEREMKAQIAFYKRHRRTFQYGRVYRFDALNDGQEAFSCVSGDGSEALTGHFRRMVHAAPGFDALPADGLDRGSRYLVHSREQGLRIGSFGRLIGYAMPVKLNHEGAVIRTADRLATLPDCREKYSASGAALLSGVRLANLFCGTGYNERVRMPGDFGSNMYVITRTGKEK